MNRSRLSRRLISAVFLVLLINSAVHAQILDSPVATVRLTETEVVTQKQLRNDIQLLEQQMGRSLNESQREEVLEAKINEILLNQGAKRDGIEVSDTEVNAAISQQKSQLGAQVSDQQFRELIQNQTGFSYDEYRDQIRNTLIQQRYVAESKEELFSNASQPSDEEIRSVYEENETSFINPSMRGFTHIFYDTRNKDDEGSQDARRRAERTYREIRNGDTSYREAVNAANDTADVQAGDFGYIQRGDEQAQALLGKDFVDAVFSLDEDEISGVLESNLGYHIVRVTDKRSPKLLSLEDPVFPGQSLTVREHITQYIMQQQQQGLLQQALEEIISELREDADITVFEDNLNW